MSFINVLEDIAPEAFPHYIPRAIAVRACGRNEVMVPRTSDK
jgi:hypothetical protein